MAGSPTGYEILGAVKVKDGLFIGDELAAQDLEFVVSNKVTRIINTSGRQVPNHWESIGVVYLTYYWVDADNQVILDQKDAVASETFRFIEEALANAESILIHSVRGQSRSCCILAAYMMRKYSWGLRKTMEFLSFRRPDMNLKPAFLQQLTSLERRLVAAKQPLSSDWTAADTSRWECEELLLRNTYLNSQMGPLAEFHSGDGVSKPRRLIWLDNDRGDKGSLEKPPGTDRHNAIEGLPTAQGMRRILKRSAYQPQPAANYGYPGSNGILSQSSSLVQPGGRWTAATGQEVAAFASTGTSANASRPPLPSAADLVPTAWAADGESAHIAYRSSVTASVAAAASEAGAGRPALIPQQFQPQPPISGHAPQQQPQFQQVGSGQGYPQPLVAGPNFTQALLQRGPATGLRDSISLGLSRRSDSPEPAQLYNPHQTSTRPTARDASPKMGPQGTGSMRRGDSPSAQRGDSPMRQPDRPRRTASPSSGTSYSPAGITATTNPLTLGFAGARSGPLQMPGSSQSQRMKDFRGGPVRAKPFEKQDLLGSDRRVGRPITAPMVRPSVSSRPASPGAAPRGNSSSRPPSPHSARTPPPLMPGHAYPAAAVDRQNPQRTLSGHLRRAPSPTPAFNQVGRASSPSKPRWRG